MAKIIMREMNGAGYNPSFIHGGVSAEDRMEEVNTFNDNEASKVIVMTEAGA